MRSRSWVFVALTLCFVFLAVLGAGLLYVTISGVSVSIVGSKIVIENTGLPIRNARIEVVDGTKIIRMPAIDIPRGSTVLRLPQQVTSYEGTTVEGERLGTNFAAYVRATASNVSLRPSGKSPAAALEGADAETARQVAAPKAD